MQILTILAIIVFVFALAVKLIYYDVFGHLPSWREIRDYHDVDRKAEGE